MPQGCIVVEISAMQISQETLISAMPLKKDAHGLSLMLKCKSNVLFFTLVRTL